MKIKFWMVALALVLLVLIMYSFTGSKVSSGRGWTVYGSHNCGWTTKQLKHMDSKGIAYDFVDCDKESCTGMSGFPTLKHDDGTVKSGYTTM